MGGRDRKKERGMERGEEGKREGGGREERKIAREGETQKCIKVVLVQMTLPTY